MEKTNLARRIAEMSRRDVKRHVRDVVALLMDRRPDVRLTAVEALARAEIGAATLRKAANHERNEVVLATICESMLLLGDRRSIPILKRLARTHRSPLVRRHAAWAVSEIAASKAVPFLKSMLRRERSPMVKATIREALVKNGHYEELDSLLAMLHSRDYRIRTSIGNFFAQNVSLKKHRDVVARRLSEAVTREWTRAASAALKQAMQSMS